MEAGIGGKDKEISCSCEKDNRPKAPCVRLKNTQGGFVMLKVCELIEVKCFYDEKFLLKPGE